jgi:signal transduction histidine kinase
MMTSRLDILLIEDDSAFACLAQTLIVKTRGVHTVTHVMRIDSALKELAHTTFDIVLTDLSLPDATGLEGVQTLRAFNPSLPLIVLTSQESEELAIQALQCGAQDYICKDSVAPNILELAIRHAIERHKIVCDNERLIAELDAQQKQLRRKNERLQQLVETAHRFVDNVSHEFRTPLTVVREYASLMRDGVLGEINEEQAEFLDVIGYRVDDLNTMVDDMLDSSKLEVGLMGAHRISTPAVSIIERSLAGLQLKAQVRGVDLSFDANADLPEVFCDPEKVGRVVTNLVSNAIKFCAEVKGRVQVSAKYSHGDKDVRISVSDNGSGIDEDGLSRMFDRFQQLGTSTQSSTKGFGLGLNIARELVDLNYGKITVDSTVGEGTTFTFTVPLDDWSEIVRRFAERLVRNDAAASVVLVRAEAADDQSESCIREIDAFWRFTERQPDLIRMTGPGQWTLLITCRAAEIGHIIERFNANHAQVSRNRPVPLPALTFDTQGCFAVADDLDSLLDAACQAACLV